MLALYSWCCGEHRSDHNQLDRSSGIADETTFVNRSYLKQVKVEPRLSRYWFSGPSETREYLSVPSTPSGSTPGHMDNKAAQASLVLECWQAIQFKLAPCARPHPRHVRAEPAAPPKVAPPPTAQSWPVPDPIVAPASPPTTAPPTVPATQPGVAGAVLEYMFADWQPPRVKQDKAITSMLERLCISSSCFAFKTA